MKADESSQVMKMSYLLVLKFGLDDDINWIYSGAEGRYSWGTDDIQPSSEGS